MKQQTKTNFVMWVPAYRSFLTSFYNSDLSHCGMKPAASLVGRGGVEPPFSVFQTGAPTVYATVPSIYSS